MATLRAWLGLTAFLAVSACGGGDASTGSTDTPASAEVPNEPAVPSNTTPAEDRPKPDGGGPAAPKNVLRFIAVGDTGTGEPAQLKVGNAIAAICKSRGCDFVQLLGDNIYDSGASSPDDAIFQERFEIPYAAVEQDFYVVLGNHDYGAEGLGFNFPKGQNEIDYTTRSKKWKLPSAYYHHVRSDVELFALDTNLTMFGRDSAQRQDMKAWIAASTATWKIAFGHHPYKSNGPHGNAGNYEGVPVPPISGAGVKSFLEERICGRVDLYLSGHDHSRQWLNVSCQGTELAVSGAGAKATELPGDNPALFQSLELGFLYIVIEDKTLTAEFIDEDGNVEFTHVLKKP